MVTLLLLGLACSGDPPTDPTNTPPPTPPPTTAQMDNDASIVAVESDRPPRIQRIQIEPQTPNTTTPVRLNLDAEDPEGRPLKTDVVWKVNGRTILEERRAQLDAQYFKRGDRITVEVEVSDKKTTINATTQVNVGNAPPKMITQPADIEDLREAIVQAEDPDGDRLTFRLSGAPEGMRIDPQSGALTYQGSPTEPGGQYTIQVLAADPDGAEAGWQFQISIQPGSDAPK